MAEEESLLNELEHEIRLRNHSSQTKFEETTISECDKKIVAATPNDFKIYPLDGRNLEFSKAKRKRLAASYSKNEAACRSICFRQLKKRGTEEESLVESATTQSFRADSNSSTEFQCPSVLWKKLYDFQQVGVKFLCSKFESNSGALLADEMGLGKSVQVIAFIQSLVTTFGVLPEPALLICPTTLVGHWLDQFDTWTSEFGLIEAKAISDFSHHDELKRSSKSKQKSLVCIVSYEMFRIRFSCNHKLKFSLVVLDEAQRIRNPDSKITLAVKQIDCHCRIALSGSPIQNNLSELWSIFDFVDPGKLGTLPTFQEELAIPIEEGTKARASYQQIQLSHRCAIVVRDLTSPLMLRRVKSEYASQLALSSKEEQVLFCQLSQEQLDVYCKFLSTETVKNVFQREKRQTGNTFYCLAVLRRISNHPDLLLSDRSDVQDFGDPSRSGKLGVLIPLLKLWKKQKKKSLIFSQSLGMLDVLELTLRNLDIAYARMDGSTPISLRNKLAEIFDASKTNRSQNGDEISCLLLSTRVGGVGLNLTAAERVVIFDPDWNPMTDAQARERSWRIGQTKTVKIYRLIAADTVEEVICKRQIYKHHIAQKILVDPRQGRVTDWDGLHDLFKAPLGRPSLSGRDHSRTTSAILKLLDNQSINLDNDAQLSSETRGVIDEDEDYKSLITKVWNQDDIELPTLCGSLVDAAEADAAATRAVRAVIAESDKTRDITVPTWTGKSGGSEQILSTSTQRSQSLVSKLRALGSPEIPSSHKPVVKNTFESEKLIIEKAVVRELLAFFQKRDRYSAETDVVLNHFAKKISAGQSEIFRSCLRELCDFDGNRWTLKRDHR